jgi:hypothetical protein
MGSRIMERPKGVSVTSPWPYNEMPESKLPRRKPTGWVLAISIDDTPGMGGLVTYYPAGTGRQVLHIDNNTLHGKRITMQPFYRVDEKEQAEKFAGTFCSMGYTKSEDLLPHQEGIFWGFNWSSLTKATVAVASQVADHYFNDRYNEAWLVGKAFGDQIHAAENAYHEAQGK